MADIESVVSRAEKMAEVAVDEAVSNRQKVAGIRENRAFEKAKRRENEGFELAPPAPESSPQGVSPNNEDCAVSKSLQPDHLDLLLQKRQERRSGQRE